MTGQTIAQYKILEKLGEGGMGVVYKAQDTKLDRVVALKFLPERLSSSAQDKARFLLEAKAASSLNHPNVCIIHDILDHDGRMFMVMEYVDGATLRSKIPAANAADAVGYAVQIGDALQDAHAKGIVHRDIKADNIMVNGKNQVKVMDFGLAKLKGTMKLTRTSSTVGTLAYMAPEQISGGEVDARSDIFSFGVVLYEMLAGRTPFRGDHEAAMVYSIVNEEPEPIQKYRPEIPAELLHVLGRALEKDPNERYQSVAEMVIDLRRLKKESTKVSRVMPAQHPTAPAALGAPPAARPPGVPKSMLWIGAAVLVVAAVAVTFFLRRGSPAPNAGAPTSLNPSMTLRVLQIPLTQVSYPGLSADGNWVSFPAGDRNGTWDIYYMHSSGTDPKRITRDSAAFNQQVSDISPDGSMVAYTQPSPGSFQPLYIVSSLGGAPRKLTDSTGLVRWRPDGRRLGFIRFHTQGRFYYELWSLNPDGSDERREFSDTAGGSGRYSFAWSPDGRSVAWIRSFPGEYQELVLRNLASGAEQQLTSDRKNIDDVCWLRNGMIVFSSNKSGNTNLWVVPEGGGPSQQLTKGSGPDIGISASADARKILYLQQQPVSYVWIASTGGPQAEQITFEDRDFGSVSLSPDKKRFAFTMSDPDPLKPSTEVYVQDRDGNNRRQLTTSGDAKFGTTWSPDGRRLAFGAIPARSSGDSMQAMLVDVDHPGTPKAVGHFFPFRWISETELLGAALNSGRTVIVSTESGRMEQVHEDSTSAFPFERGAPFVYLDQRAGREGFWFLPKGGKALLIEKADNILSNYLTREKFLYKTKSREWWSYHLATGKRERLNSSFPGLEQGAGSMSADGSELIYAVRKLSAKLVMIEDAFQ